MYDDKAVVSNMLWMKICSLFPNKLRVFIPALSIHTSQVIPQIKIIIIGTSSLWELDQRKAQKLMDEKYLCTHTVQKFGKNTQETPDRDISSRQ